MLTYILNRGKELSTWLGILALFGTFGVHLAPEQLQAIAQAGVAIVAAIVMFLPEIKK